MATIRLLGHNIGYSASPAMHAAAFSTLGLDHRYEVADVGAQELPAAVATLRDARVLGANVTVPYKEPALALVDEIDSASREARAVNTIINRDGRLLGSNTDVPAVADDIRLLRPKPRHALVLGAGGAARAVEIALVSLGARRITRVSRSGRDGAASWEDLPRLVADVDLLVNATPVGTATDESPLDAAHLHAGMAVLDLVYRPSPTRLVHEARARGLRARAGAGVLLGQGWRSLEGWLSTTASGATRRAMADALCGELGSGADV